MFEKDENAPLDIKGVKLIATAILVTALEDADVGFFRTEWCQTLQDMADTYLTAKDIPSEILEQRKIYENNNMEFLMDKYGYTAETLDRIARNHGWMIGKFYEEKDIFEI